MKKISPKSLLVVLVICLLIPVVYVLCNRSTKRMPTEWEIQSSKVYEVNWQELGEGTDREVILSLCTFQEEKVIGNNSYRAYLSNGLENYLHDFGEMMEIVELEDIVYIQYTTSSGNMITLGYADDGLREKGIYDLATDTFYYDLNGNIEVWNKFRNGFQFGEG